MFIFNFQFNQDLYNVSMQLIRLLRLFQSTNSPSISLPSTLVTYLLKKPGCLPCRASLSLDFVYFIPMVLLNLLFYPLHIL